MKQLKIYSDERLEGLCIYCGKNPTTRDHVPSKILLDKPYPTNLPVVPCCKKCNEGFSLDEEYFSCFIECVIAGSTEPNQLGRNKIKRILANRPKLKARIQNSMTIKDDRTYFSPESDRIQDVNLKLAKGHATYENSEIQIETPICISIDFLSTMTETDKIDFFSLDQGLLPEVGSRALQRIFNEDKGYENGWVKVQENNYMYSINHGFDGLNIKFLIRDYLACKVVWN